jgi:long-chain fatty acid transport protein
VNWSEFTVKPTYFSSYNPIGLATFEDTTSYTLGVARKFTETWSGAASLAIEPKGNDLVSALAPINGRKGISLAAIYTQDAIKVTTGITYARMGDATPEVGGQPAARTDDNDVWGAGVKIGYSF